MHYTLKRSLGHFVYAAVTYTSACHLPQGNDRLRSELLGVEFLYWYSWLDNVIVRRNSCGNFVHRIVQGLSFQTLPN